MMAKWARSDRETEISPCSVPFIHEVSKEPPASVVLLQLDEELVFHGIVSLRVLLGCVWINGFCLKPSHEAMEIHSPTTGSCLAVMADNLPVSSSLPDDRAVDVAKSKGKKRKKKKSTLKKALLVDCDRDRICQIIENSGKDWVSLGAVVLLQRQESFLVDFITGISKQFSDLYGIKTTTAEKTISSLPRFHPLSSSSLPCISISTQWEQSVAGILEYCMNFKPCDIKGYDTPVVVVCGAKNCGKSTFSRFLANTLLNKFPLVAFLETDVGQTEFTPPGFVALNILSQPIIGPPFCHQRSPYFGHFFGDVTPKERPGFYLKCVASCFTCWCHDPDMSNTPLIVNTSGWVKGLGILLLADVLRIMRPTHIVQLQLDGSTKNASPINTEFLLSAPGWRQNMDIQRHWPVSGSGYPVINILDSFACSSGVDQSSSRRLLALLADCSKLFNRDSLGTFTERHSSQRYVCKLAGPLSTCLPYKVAWKSVAVCILHEKVSLREIVCSLNGSIVGLGICSKELTGEWFKLPEAKSLHCLNENSLPRCIGLGIIRAVDCVSGHFYVSTSLVPSQLNSVNVLLKGALEIPLCLLLQGGCRFSSHPYVSREFQSLVQGSSVRKNRQQLRRRSGASGAAGSYAWSQEEFEPG